MRKYFSFLMIFFAVIIISLLFLVFQNYQSFSVYQKEITIKEQDLRSQEEYFQKLQEIAEKLEKNKDLLAKIETGLPLSPEVPELLAFVQKSASQSGLALGSISLGSSVVDEKIKKTKVNFIVTGDYDGFKKFLSFIENSSRLIDIDTIHFSYPEKIDEFRFNIKITAYSY
ncbi:MAG: type 4a pilus biogenesis protein PilO [Patescibacteria group bacterium]|nr:type 4a pilus biogenesis protein PilO [Patescibacteria group bacterium]